MKVRATGGGGGESNMKDLETKLLETRMLYATTIDDYDIVSKQAHKVESCIIMWFVLKKFIYSLA